MRARIPRWSALALALVLPLAWLGLPTIAAAQQRGEKVVGEERLALGPDVIDAAGPPEGPPLSGDELEARTHALSLEIRCPVCQGQAIADSPAESARHMKRQTRAMLAAGYTPEQVLNYFETSYGEFIRLRPRPEGLNLLVWLLPLLAMLLGGVVVWRVVRARPQAAGAGAASGAGAVEGEAEDEVEAQPDPSAEEDPDLQRWLEQVRRETRQSDD